MNHALKKKPNRGNQYTEHLTLRVEIVGNGRRGKLPAFAPEYLERNSERDD
jgi:hypothetical protein